MLKQLRDRQWMSSAVARLQAAAKFTPPKQSLYIIKLNGLYKIGISLNPRKRIKGMQLPGVPEFVCVVPECNAKYLESSLHEYFCDQRVHGEWFDLTEDDLLMAHQIIRFKSETEQT